MKILITGGAGFIGSALVRKVIQSTSHSIVNVDKLTYAGNLESLSNIANHQRYRFEQVDICDAPKLSKVFSEHKPDAVMHLAAESHVDRSIDAPGNFVHTNIVGTFNMLQVAHEYWVRELARRDDFRFYHISTDEVFGSLGSVGKFDENTPYSPQSPYSASKAGSDHLVAAWFHTYGFPVLISNCSNNYGPCQFPEKLIPLMILNALRGTALPVYGNGLNIRDWLFVDDHVSAMLRILEAGKIGQTYLVGGGCEKTNLEVVETICKLMDDLLPESKYRPHKALISFVKDRPGHDFRYAIDASRTTRELGWSPSETFDSGIKKTIQWYLENKPWWENVLNGRYKLNRLGLG